MDLWLLYLMAERGENSEVIHVRRYRGLSFIFIRGGIGKERSVKGSEIEKSIRPWRDTKEHINMLT